MSTGLRDALTFGAVRRRRRIRRLLRKMDRLDARSARNTPRDPSGRWRGVASLAAFLAAVAGLAYVLGWLPGSHRTSSTQATGSGQPPSGLQDVLRPQSARSLSVPRAGVAEQSARLLPPVSPPPGSGGFTYLPAVDGQSAHWDPCRAIHYVIRDLPGTPTGGDDAIVSAVTAASKASGIAFVYDGKTDEAPSRLRKAYLPARYGDRWAPVLIAWSNPSEMPDLAGDVLGIASPLAYGTTAGPAYVSATVALDTPSLTTLDPARYGFSYQSIVEHELGHVLGLDHVEDPSQIMNPTAAGVLSYQAGDLRGLAALGRGACHPEL